MPIICRIFKIHPGEYNKAIYIAALFSLIGFYNTIIESTALSVFDIRLGTEYFPMLYMVFPFFNLMLSGAFFPALKKMPAQKLFKYFVFLLAAVHLFNLAVILGMFSSKYMYGFLMLSSMLIVENIIFLSMLMLQDLVSIESIKRLLPLSAASITLGSIAAALVIRGLSKSVPVWVVFLTVLAVLPVLGFLSGVLYSRHRVIKAEKKTADGNPIGDSFAYIRENPFYIVIIIVSTVVVLSYTTNNYLFNFHASSIFKDESNLFAFLGKTQAYQYLAAFLAGAFLFSRIITRIGAQNMMKVVLANIIISMTLMGGGVGFVYPVMLSRIISREFMLETNHSLMQIFYQPANPRYKEGLVTFHNVIVGFLGCILGGSVTILHSKGILGTFGVVALTVALAVAALVLWNFNQRGFVAVIENTMRTAGTNHKPDIGQLAGKLEAGRLWEYIEARISKGGAADLILALEFTTLFPKDKKEKMVAGIYRQGALEARLRAVDVFFGGHVAWDCLMPYTVKMDVTTKNYILSNLFQKHGKIDREDMRKLRASLMPQGKENLDFLALRSYEYFLEGKREAYAQVLELLWSGGNEDQLRMLLEIMENFAEVEGDVNRRYLTAFAVDLKGKRDLVAGAVKLCACFDKADGGMKFFRSCILKVMKYEVIVKAVEEYGAEYLIKGLCTNPDLLSQVYILYAIRTFDSHTIKNHEAICEEVILKLAAVKKEKKRIQEEGGTGRKILVEELAEMLAVAETIVIEYLYCSSGLSPVEKLYEHMRDRQRREMALEVINGSIPKKHLLTLQPLINTGIEEPGQGVGPDLSGIGDCMEVLKDLYNALNGLEIDSGLKEQIERVCILKKVPMFSELDYDMLHNAVKIAGIKEFSKGERVVEKGEPGDSFYVVLEGKLTVHLSVHGEAIAALQKGDIFGELAVLDKGLRTATVFCESEAKLLEFRGSDFIRLLENNGTMALKVFKILSKRLAGMKDTRKSA